MEPIAEQAEFGATTTFRAHFKQVVRTTPQAYRRAFGARDKRFVPHQLRHAHAVEMAREGVPLIVIQRQLGHTNLGITSIIRKASTAPRSSTPSTPAVRRSFRSTAPLARDAVRRRSSSIALAAICRSALSLCLNAAAAGGPSCHPTSRPRPSEATASRDCSSGRPISAATRARSIIGMTARAARSRSRCCWLAARGSLGADRGHAASGARRRRSRRHPDPGSSRGARRWCSSRALRGRRPGRRGPREGVEPTTAS